MTAKIEHTASVLKQGLREAADPEFRRSQRRFFKEPVRVLGVRAADLRRLAATAAKEYRRARLAFQEILEISDRLWRRGTVEERMLAIIILSKFQGDMEPRHWKHFDGWIDSLGNWAETDGLCTELFAALIEREPDLVERLPPWTRSRNRWRRRSAAVALVPLARRGDQHDAAFDICKRLAVDRDDMVEKGIGWLLKEISRTQPQAVAGFLLADIDRFSRTTVRYACEKLPSRLRSKVMSA